MVSTALGDAGGRVERRLDEAEQKLLEGDLALIAPKKEEDAGILAVKSSKKGKPQLT